MNMMTQVEIEDIPRREDVHILIVDDDEVVLEVLKSYIASFGFQYSTAADGLEACQHLQKQDFPIIITDINMPNMGGMELLQYVNIHHPQTGVIVVTGLSEEYSYVDVISAGAIDYITKPFDGSELLAKLQRVIREQSLIKKLEQISICDSLTKLYNRRYFDKKISEELQRAVRQNYEVYLAFFDVDFFKGYNDKYGHQAGDNLLATLGQIMLGCARRTVDWTFRYGGDEFAVIITQTTKEQALSVCKRILSTYEEHRFGDTSLSCGLAQFQKDPELAWSADIEKFISTTDQALYDAKNKGRHMLIARMKEA